MAIIRDEAVVYIMFLDVYAIRLQHEPQVLFTLFASRVARKQQQGSM
jgi:hypothetical protein